MTRILISHQSINRHRQGTFLFPASYGSSSWKGRVLLPYFKRPLWIKSTPESTRFPPLTLWEAFVTRLFKLLPDLRKKRVSKARVFFEPKMKAHKNSFALHIERSFFYLFISFSNSGALASIQVGLAIVMLVLLLKIFLWKWWITNHSIQWALKKL